MSNLTIKLNYFLKNLTGRFPQSDAIETQDQALRKEYNDFLEFTKSDDLKHFEELKSWFATKEFEKVKSELKALTFKASPEYQIEKEFMALSKNKALKNYLAVAQTETPKKYTEIEKSGLPHNFAELENFVKSPEYKQNRNQYKKENTEEYQKELAYLELKENSDLKEYQRLKKWKPLQDYFSIKESDILKKYNELESKINSDEFKERKAYLLSTDKFEKTDSYSKLQEYLTLAKSEKILWYFDCQKKDKFADIKRWELTFSEDFTDKKINRNIWITRFFWGEALINSGYSLASDSQWYTDGDNLEIRDSILKINTLKQDAEGLAWDAKYGFIPKTFKYTSGLISTGNSFRQKYGRFEAKVKISCAQGVYHAMWLVGDRMLPEIDIFRKKDDKQNSLQGAFFWDKNVNGKPGKSLSNAGSLDLSKFYILGIEWNENMITWTINGIPYKIEKNNLPQGPVYLVLSSGVNGQVDDSKLPVALEVDWIKCWSEIKN